MKDHHLLNIELSTDHDRVTHIATVVHEGETITVREKIRSVLPPMCRKLLRKGLDPTSCITASRSGMPVLARPVQIKSMAEVNFLDGDSYGLRKVRYVPRGDINSALP